MAKTDICGGERSPNDAESESVSELQWSVAKALLDANAHSTQAFEYHLLQTHLSGTSSNWDQVQECLYQAIDQHRKIIEELELAAEIVEELKDDERA